MIAAFSENLSAWEARHSDSLRGWIDEMLKPIKSVLSLRLYCKGERLTDERCLRIHNFGGEEYASLCSKRLKL